MKRPYFVIHREALHVFHETVCHNLFWSHFEPSNSKLGLIRDQKLFKSLIGPIEAD